MRRYIVRELGGFPGKGDPRKYKYISVLFFYKHIVTAATRFVHLFAVRLRAILVRAFALNNVMGQLGVAWMCVDLCKRTHKIVCCMHFAQGAEGLGVKFVYGYIYEYIYIYGFRPSGRVCVAVSLRHI